MTSPLPYCCKVAESEGYGKPHAKVCKHRQPEPEPAPESAPEPEALFDLPEARQDSQRY